MIARLDGIYIRMIVAMLGLGIKSKHIASVFGVSHKFVLRIKKNVKWDDCAKETNIDS